VQGRALKDKDAVEAFLKVRTYECDAYGHVNNAVYLNYLEYGRMAVLEKAGFTLAKLKSMGVLIVVRRIEIDYKASAQEGEELVILTFLKEHHKMKGVFHQEIFKHPDETLVARADVTWVFVDREGKLIPIPDFFREALGL
jgi:YbgC/YbaW family acyl-CoA thioester hydrolase